MLISVDNAEITNGSNSEESPTAAPSKIPRIPLGLNFINKTRRRRRKKDKDSTSNNGSIKDTDKDSESM